MKLPSVALLAAAIGSVFSFSGSAFAFPTYTVTMKIPMNADCSESKPSLNDLGWVASGEYLYGANGPGSVTKIDPGSANIVCAVAVNKAGEVVGIMDPGAPYASRHDFLTGPKGIGFIDLTSIGSGIQTVHINNAGWLAGTLQSQQAFISGPKGLGVSTFDIGGGYVTGLNSSGQMTGVDRTAGFQPFITGPNGIGKTIIRKEDIGVDYGDVTSTRINDSGQLLIDEWQGCGIAHITGPNGVGRRNIFPPVNYRYDHCATGYGINNAGQIVGWAQADGEPERWVFVTGPNGFGLTDLNSLVTLSDGAKLVGAAAINNAGQIIAYDTNGIYYLLSPGPDPDDKNNGDSCKYVSTPHPINGGTGNKYLAETDYAASGAGGLHFRRQYNSRGTNFSGNLGTAWRHNYISSVRADFVSFGTQFIGVIRPNGTTTSFVAMAGDLYAPQDSDVTDKLVRLSNQSGWKYTVAADDTIETYDSTGRLSSIQERSGLTQTLTYNTVPSGGSSPTNKLLLAVTDSFGRQLNFSYDSAGRINKMVDPSGQSYLYNYDSNNNLASVAYPGDKTKSYQFNESANTSSVRRLLNALTGITDENGSRYASYYYDSLGRAYSENHAGIADQYQLTYNADGKSTTITDPKGVARTYGLTTVLGVINSAGNNQPGGSGCNASSQAITYDANGNVAARTDFNGILFTYAYDMVRNLETKRTEASGKPEARTITTAWHPTYRLPAKIAEPKRLTSFTYDAKGNLLSKIEQATTDATGATGLTAPVIGTARQWTFTYNALGQVLTATGPRSDVIDKTTYVYDSQGNLTTITNAAGQITTLSNYDANGRVGRIVDPNGLTTDLTYSPRGWLTAKNVGGEITGYQYDGVGQLKVVTLPDASSITYSYDDAHRLTDIADNLGNHIAYTLDSMGNRVNEQVKDPSGMLARQTSRVYDALNRLQTITGAAQ